ncbi:hypothetical protein FQA39_LY14773 [Lamprigera yunnana]|nr:hypothetical protein FQA39_LY14773 [Lamprigera yunnana]
MYTSYRLPTHWRSCVYCPAVFDGWVCWPDTAAGESASHPCPGFIVGFDPDTYEEMDKHVILPDEYFNESDDSETEDHIETRTIDSDTDHDVNDEDECE